MEIAPELKDALVAKLEPYGLTVSDEEAASFMQQVIMSVDGIDYTSATLPLRMASQVWQERINTQQEAPAPPPA